MVATTIMHKDAYDVDRRGVSRLKTILEELGTKKARGASIKCRVKWKQVGDMCSMKFFREIKQKNIMAVILELEQ